MDDLLARLEAADDTLQLLQVNGVFDALPFPWRVGLSLMDFWSKRRITFYFA